MIHLVDYCLLVMIESSVMDAGWEALDYVESVDK